MHAYETQVHIGPDGILRLEVPVHESETDINVLVVLTKSSGTLDMEGVYGSCAGLGFQEPPDLPLQPCDLNS